MPDQNNKPNKLPFQSGREGKAKRLIAIADALKERNRLPIPTETPETENAPQSTADLFRQARLLTPTPIHLGAFQILSDDLNPCRTLLTKREDAESWTLQLSAGKGWSVSFDKDFSPNFSDMELSPNEFGECEVTVYVKERKTGAIKFGVIKVVGLFTAYPSVEGASDIES